MIHAPRRLFLPLTLALGLHGVAAAQGLDGPPGPAIEPQLLFSSISRSQMELDLSNLFNVKVHIDSITISRSGRIVYTQLPSAISLEGQTTADELGTLLEAVRLARFDGLPKSLSPSDAKGVRVTYSFTGGVLDKRQAEGVAGQLKAQFAARVDPVAAALDAIADRLRRERPRFRTASLQLTLHDGGTWRVRVVSNGTTKVSRAGPKSATWSGTATPEQLQRLNEVIDGSDRSEVPTELSSNLKSSGPGPQRPFVLQVDALNATRSVETRGVEHRTGKWSGQLDALILALTRIGDQVTQTGSAAPAAAPHPAPASGIAGSVPGK